MSTPGQDSTTAFKEVHRSQVLLVEDSSFEAEIASRAFSRTFQEVELRVVRTGEEALDYLRRQGSHAKATRPNLILLDLNLPGIDGHEVLQEIKSDPVLRSIPVVIFSNSKDAQDIERAYHAHANAFIQKPLLFEAFVQVIHTTLRFWITVVSRADR